MDIIKKIERSDEIKSRDNARWKVAEENYYFSSLPEEADFSELSERIQNFYYDDGLKIWKEKRERKNRLKALSRERAKSTLSTREALSEWLIRQMAILQGNDSININTMFYESLNDTQKKNVERILSKEWNDKIHAIII